MPGSRPVVKKTDESDFAFVIEDASDSGRGHPFIVINGRVFDNPVRHKSVSIGRGQTKSESVCIHGRLSVHPCPTCEYEAPRVAGGGWPVSREPVTV